MAVFVSNKQNEQMLFQLNDRTAKCEEDSVILLMYSVDKCLISKKAEK